MDEVPEAAAAVAAFPIVGIGASAGGLEAFEQFFCACPVDTGMAFVLVPHLDPGHESLLTEILQRTTTMPVVQVLDQTRVEPDRVYVIPPNREMSVLNRVLHLSMPELARGQRMPIDAFLRSLAEDQAEKAIGVILSGTATDGTLGLRAILGAGGVCMVQEPSTAKYDGMPQSAIAAGYATHILPVEKMPAMLREIAGQSAFRQKVPAIATEKALSGMNQILLQIRSATGHDFSLYKKSTIGRRIERRMAQHHIEDTAVYARYLKENPAEVHVLFKELLINVTSFFRDPAAFVALKQTILPPLLAGKPEGYAFRVWVAGCASGEEAYSIAMVLLELMDEIKARHEQEMNIQIYATDLDDEAIAVARAGRYRTLDNVIAGVVLTFTNVTDFKLASIKLGEAQKARFVLAEGIVNTVAKPLIILDHNLQVLSANFSFYTYFMTKEKDTVGRKLISLGDGQWNIPALLELFENILPGKEEVKGYIVEHDFPGIGPHRMVLNARRIATTAGNTEFILLAMMEIEPLKSP